MFTITVTPNLYPRSVTFFLFHIKLFFSFFLFFILLFSIFFTLVQKCNSCKIEPWCRIIFVQFCSLVQFYALVQIWLCAILCIRATLLSCTFVPSCNFVFVQFRPVPISIGELRCFNRIK